MNLTEQEFNVMDELYFVTPYSQLKNLVQLSDALLKSTLVVLIQKGFVVQLVFNENEYAKNLSGMLNDIENHAYLCTKEGLLAHNLK